MTGVGILVDGFPSDHSLIDVARAVERGGFDSIWTGDHVLSSVDGLVAVAAFGAATESLEIGTSVYLPHLRPTVVVARMLATLNAAGLSERFTFGVGVGGDVPDEFDVVGLDIHRRGRLLDTCLDELVALFTDTGPVRFEAHGTLAPIWIGGRSSAAVARTARVGTGFAPYLVTLEQFSALAAQLRDATAGRAPASVALNTLIAVDGPSGSGLELARQAQPFGLTGDLIDRYVVLGTAEECVQRLASYVAAGATHVVLNLAVPATAKLEQLSILATEVLPALHRLTSPFHPPAGA